MDLQTLRFFVAAAEKGSFSSAAESLLYAQSNLSNRIKQLEAELGENLFYRYKKGVSLTAKGRIFYDYAIRILNMTEEATIAVQDVTEAKGELILGSLEATALKDLPELLSTYHSDYPNVKLSLQTDMHDSLLKQTLNRTLDGAFVAGPSHHPDLEEISFQTEKLILVGNPKLSGHSPDQLLMNSPLITFPEGSIFRHRLEMLLSSKSFVYADRLNTMNSLSANIFNICSGLGVGYLPESITQPYIEQGLMKHFPLEDPYCKLKVNFIYRKDHIKDAAFRYFIKAIRDKADTR